MNQSARLTPTRTYQAMKAILMQQTALEPLPPLQSAIGVLRASVKPVCVAPTSVCRLTWHLQVRVEAKRGNDNNSSDGSDNESAVRQLEKAKRGDDNSDDSDNESAVRQLDFAGSTQDEAFATLVLAELFETEHTQHTVRQSELMLTAALAGNIRLISCCVVLLFALFDTAVATKKAVC